MESEHKGRATGKPGLQDAQWAAPREDGAALIWPAPTRILALARENASRLDSADLQINGVALPQLRRAARTFLAQSSDVPLIATGHQCELQHPGVWVKNAVICAAAEALSGEALHVAIDTDAPKHLKLKWPGFAAPITDDPRLNTAAWTALIDPPAPAYLASLMGSAHEAEGRGLASGLVGQFLGTCRAYLMDQRDAIAPLNLPAMLANAQHALDWELGLRYSSLTLSGLLESEPWAHFASFLATQAQSLAHTYNSVLAEHRRQAGIDSPERPVPDLLVSRARVEIPFWLDELATGRRHRAEVLITSDGPALAGPAGADAFRFGQPVADAGALLGWLRHHRVRLGPRALSLTMFLRLCVCDLFIHGIGGGLYDQVTDQLIRTHLGLEPPAFAVATATLYHPLAGGRERASLDRLKGRAHHLAHDALGPQKRSWLAKIAAAKQPRERRALFEQMHEARRRALATDQQWLSMKRRLREAEMDLAAEADIFDRELFYAIQPAARLARLISQVRDGFLSSQQ